MTTINRFKNTQKILSTEESGTSNFIERENADADIYLKECLSLIKCECGAEILVVPDLRAMNCAINNHVSEHRKWERTIQNKEIASNKISKLLSQLTLIKAGEENGT